MSYNLSYAIFNIGEKLFENLKLLTFYFSYNYICKYVNIYLTHYIIYISLNICEFIIILYKP